MIAGSACPLAFTSLVLAATLSAARPQQEDPARPQDLTELSLEELLELKVTVSVASLFDESELLLGSTVERIGRDQWRRRGARTLADAIGASPGVLVAPNGSREPRRPRQLLPVTAGAEGGTPDTGFTMSLGFRSSF